MVIALPRDVQLSTGELRPTIGQVRSRSTQELIAAMNDASNWVGLLTHFDYERALSGYIAAYPHRLEDGLLPHPNERVRERIFRDGSRSDVLLADRSDVPAVDLPSKLGLELVRGKSGTQIWIGGLSSLNLSANFGRRSGESGLPFDCGLPGFDDAV